MLTKLDCHYHTEHGADAGGRPNSFVILNPIIQPGSIVAACATGAGESIASQLACRLALEHFVEGALEAFSNNVAQLDPSDLANLVLEAAFKRANSSVYAFGHKLAAAGRMGTGLVGMVVNNNFVACGRAGPGSAYLLRKHEVFPFFATKNGNAATTAEQENLVGAHSVVSVELASVPLEDQDFIYLFSNTLDATTERRLCAIASSSPPSGENPAAFTARRITSESCKIEFSLRVDIGPSTIYLDKALNSN